MQYSPWSSEWICERRCPCSNHQGNASENFHTFLEPETTTQQWTFTFLLLKLLTDVDMLHSNKSKIHFSIQSKFWSFHSCLYCNLNTWHLSCIYHSWLRTSEVLLQHSCDSVILINTLLIITVITILLQLILVQSRKLRVLEQSTHLHTPSPTLNFHIITHVCNGRNMSLSQQK